MLKYSTPHLEKAKRLTCLHKLSFIISLLILASLTPILNIEGAPMMTVQTDQSSYSIGDNVIIQVYFADPTDPWPPGVIKDIILEISTPTGWPIERTITVTSNAEGEFMGTYPFSLDNADPGSYTVIAHVYGNHMESNVATFTVAGGAIFDFSISLSPSSLTVEAGKDATFKVLLTYSDPSFSGTVVTIQLTGLGPGMTFQLSGLGDLMIYTTSSTPAGTYPITVIGSANGVIRQTSGTLIVQEQTQPFEFSVSISPTSRTLSLGNTGTFTVTVTLTSGNPEIVTLSLNGLPGDIQHTFSPASGNPTFTSTLTIDTSGSSSTGTYPFTVNANAAGQIKTATATLTVNEEADFSISITPPERTINQGESTTFTVTMNEIGEFNEQVTLTASGLPTGATPNFGPTSGTPTFTATLNIDTLESSPAGSYTVTVDASGGGKSHSVTASLTIKEKSNETTSEVQETETKQNEDIDTSGLPTSEMLMNPRNLMLIVIAILVIALIVILVRRGRRPTIKKTDTSTPKIEKPDTSSGYCTKCGVQLKPGTTFCSSCGTRME